jgi:hypothetical protein
MITRLNKLLLISLLGPVLLGQRAGANTVEVDANILAGTTNVWVATNTYLLKKVIFVETNAVLKIEPGTVIKGATGTNVSGASPGITPLISALIVQRGGKLFAEGTAARPIVFTYDGDDVNDPNDVPLYTSGQWGGVVLLGQAVINGAFNAAGNMATPKYEVYEGLTDVVTNGAAIYRFGGTNDNDSSGVLRYVSIRHSGINLSANREFNGLTMGAIGRGTTLEHIEVYSCSDDGFEWWGGTCNARYLVAAFCDDDGFDFDQGFRGDLQFLFAIQRPNVDVDFGNEPRGIETDGDVANVNDPTQAAFDLPVTQWRGYNITLIGPGLASGNFGIISRDDSGPNVFNSVVTEFGTGLRIDLDGLQAIRIPGIDGSSNSAPFAFGYGDFRHNLFNVTTPGSGADVIFTNAAVRKNDLGNPLLAGVSRTNNYGLDPRPAPASPVFTNLAAIPATGYLQQTCYRGAFDLANWADWAAINLLGFMTTNGSTRLPQALTFPVEYSSVTTTSNAFLVSYPTSMGQYYQVQTTTNFASPTSWIELSRTRGTGSIITNTFALNPDQQRYFRVRLVCD